MAEKTKTEKPATLSLRDQLLAFTSDTVEEVTTISHPTLGTVKVLARGLSLNERIEMNVVAVKKDSDGDYRYDRTVGDPMLLILGLHDPETKERLFTEKDLPAVQKLLSGPVDHVIALVEKLSCMGGAAQEDAAKN